MDQVRIDLANLQKIGKNGNLIVKPLKQKFFMRDTIRVAEDLIGCYLIRKTRNSVLVGCIVETEAYLGLDDPCCHSFNGSYTDRTQVMYLVGGHSYVYFIYGMHHCFNVVTQNKEKPEAVLIRALEPLEGVVEMKENRKKEKLTDLCSGPGKLCQAFNITKSLNAKNLSREGEIYISRKKEVQEIETDRRVGLPLHKDSAHWPLRFYIKNNSFVSLKKKQMI